MGLMVSSPREPGTYRLVSLLDEHGVLDVAVEARRVDGWETVQSWQLRCGKSSTARGRREGLEVSAAEAGWRLPSGRWPQRTKTGRQTVGPLEVENWLTVLATATEYRQSAIAAFVAMDRAWREVVTDAVFTGGVGKSAAGEATGLTRFRIHQILGAKKADSTELVKIAEAIAQDRTSPDQTTAEDADDDEAAVL